MAFENFPYTDFHNLNLDWILKTTKDLNEKWDFYFPSWEKDLASFRAYFDNINYQSEINSYMDKLYSNGTLATMVNNWLVNYGVITVGDSYAVGYNPDGNVTGWPSILHSQYMYDADFWVDVSKSGSGFFGGAQFYDLLKPAIEKLTADQKQRVKYVIFAGGWNDGNASTYNEVSEQIQRCCKLVNDNLPNATTYIGWIATPLLDNKYATLDTLRKFTTAKSAWSTASARYKTLYNVDLALRWKNLVGSDHCHPNQNGQYAIAKAIYKALDGANFHVREDSFNISGYSDNITVAIQNGGNCWVQMENRTAHITIGALGSQIKCTFTTPITIGATGFGLMKHDIPFVDETCVCYCKVSIHNDSGYQSTTGALVLNAQSATNRDIGSVWLKIVDNVTGGYKTYSNVDSLFIYNIEWNVPLY